MISDDVRFRYKFHCYRNAFAERVQVTVERKWNANGTQLEREWNANGTRMERKWKANGTHLGMRSGRVPNAFSVRLFLSSTVIDKSNHWSLILYQESIAINRMKPSLNHGTKASKDLVIFN
jgi:hypothetical protein